MQVGDKVVWFSNGKRGRVYTFRKGHGTIKSIEDGVAVCVTDCNGHVRKPVEDLTLRADDRPFSIFIKALETV